MKLLRARTSLVAAAAISLFVATQSFAAQDDELLGVHQVLDPNATTDDIGITVPIPISHPGRRYPATDEFPTGPDIGEALPSITLSNQHGESINLDEHRDGSRAVVVFFRSVVW